MSFFQTAFVFLVVLSVLVFVHELGHFVVAKRAGITVQEFGFGYPPRLFGIKFGETIYSINLLPLGGFVKMLGENAAPGDPGAFASKSKRVRAAVLVAGSLMNFLLVPVLFSAAFMVGESVPCGRCERVQIYGIQPGSPAASAGLQEGDIFVTIDGQPIKEPDDVRRLIRAVGERPIEVVVRRDTQNVSLRMTPRMSPQEGRPIIGIALGPEFVTVKRPIWEAVPLGIERTADTLRLFAQGIGQIVSREQPAELAGPVGIAAMTGRYARAGLTYLLQFTAFLSLNLAIFNMLPIPGLDGARLAFVAVEGVRGERINPRIEGAIHFVGLMLLITLMLFVSYNDVRRLMPT
ncbi:MAG: RIP metalloprotease RseP [Chloroflexi bacterium]|nr:RIP metalloprotease RseP [Chloroflexota bacterium]